jgi:hypothetical protein
VEKIVVELEAQEMSCKAFWLIKFSSSPSENVEFDNLIL